MGGDSRYLAVFVDGEICGGVSLVCKDGRYSWVLFFKPQTSSFVISACAFCFLDFAFLQTKTLEAVVKNSNHQALKFDKNFGFREIYKDENLTFLSQNLAQWNEHKNTKLMQKISKISDEFDIQISA